MVVKFIRKRAKKAAKATNHGKSTKATRVFNVNKPVYTWLTMDIIKKSFKKGKATSNGTLDTTIIISDLTNSTGTSNASDAPVLIPLPLSIGFVNAGKPIGHPKGTTVKSSHEKLECIEAMLTSIAANGRITLNRVQAEC